ncbi:uncharacterized protein LOC142226956 isoform X2 [Haematobia irritans]|uniref:uncharacterized protein LOC142226956 isoform X2 n=1 Tax=Haematobia irritans TaxID=7368 RepID=UPI003F4F830A
MAGTLKYVFLAVAVVCYMQCAEMARLPRNTAPTNTNSEPAVPANFLEALSKPEFFNNLFANISAAFTEDNLKKYGINPSDVKEGFAKVQENFQNGVAELQKNVNTLIEQQPADAKPKKTKK